MNQIQDSSNLFKTKSNIIMKTSRTGDKIKYEICELIVIHDVGQ